MYTCPPSIHAVPPSIQTQATERSGPNAPQSLNQPYHSTPSHTTQSHEPNPTHRPRPYVKIPPQEKQKQPHPPIQPANPSTTVLRYSTVPTSSLRPDTPAAPPHT
ncbi:uncharacterized protein BO95DRAFT_440471 [Aspergillus brunneoviolaceus CBS 621.78]|uniref:Uncharacterized protein n=1 Tax=Aspergillus brunneoviolaceus CBS 621.78 TaxID=1450534 RepID=A0ACD1GG47_9EURO|nr:hypothetical protein BO95DRAFT_440471 [Aspergillus brunneoviolaceus CBS 621.78]RAH48157.1 hypothetical protein BO95DRAFT_440471 [Aspergillus brunneoviolaceus CBS 621.78]